MTHFRTKPLSFSRMEARVMGLEESQPCVDPILLPSYDTAQEGHIQIQEVRNAASCH